jgi:hypothetical protein
MAVNVAVLIESKDAEQAQTVQYTSTGLTTIIDKFTATNHDTAAWSITVYLVPSGGSAATTNKIVASKTLQANETYTFPEIVGAALAAGDFIATEAPSTGGNKINIRSSGRLIS